MNQSSSTLASHKVLCAWKTHKGNFRANNEDAVLIEPLDLLEPQDSGSPPSLIESSELTTGGLGFIALICDGVGGGTAGEIASSVTTHTFRDRLKAEARALNDQATDETCRACMLSAVKAAHSEILQQVIANPALEGMASTLTAVWLHQSKLYLAQVGDSRLYLLRSGELEQLSHDQSLVGGLRRSGTISEAEARRHPLRNIIDQAIGGSNKDLVPDVEHFEIRPGDEFLLCSDGLNDALTDNSLKHLLLRLEHEVPEVTAQTLLQAALDSAGRDNISVALLRIEEAGTPRWIRALSQFASRIVPNRG
jgi:PPM family protein phosphatase